MMRTRRGRNSIDAAAAAKGGHQYVYECACVTARSKVRCAVGCAKFVDGIILDALVWVGVF